MAREVPRLQTVNCVRGDQVGKMKSCLWKGMDLLSIANLELQHAFEPNYVHTVDNSYL